MARLPIVICAAWLGLAGLRAQEPGAEAQRLQQLLHELQQLNPDAWKARLAALEQAAAAADGKAKALRADAAKLQEQAAAQDAEAKQRRAEAVRLQELQQLLGGLPPTPKAKQAETKPAAKPAEKPAEKPAQPPPERPKVSNDAKSAPAAPPAALAATEPDATIVAWSQVEALLQDRCAGCHEPSDKKGGLDVTTFAAIQQGGGSGKTIVPGDPDQSRLWRMVAQQERPFMPKGEDPLTVEQVALLRRWIEHGAAESTAAGRAFLAARAAAAAGATNEPDEANGPLPHALPAVPLQSPARPGPLKALVRSPNAPLLALPGHEQVLLCTPSLQPLGVLPVNSPTIDPLGFSSDGTLLVAGIGEPGRRGQAVVFDIATGAERARVADERDVPLAVAVHKNAGLIALGGAGKRAMVRAFDGREVLVGAHDDFVLALQFSPDGTLLAAGDRAGEVRLWEAQGGGLVETLRGHQGAVHALVWNRRGDRLFTAGADGTVRAFDPHSGKQLWQQAAHSGQALAIAIGPDQRIASAGSDGRIAVFDAAGKALGKSPAAGEWLYAVAFGDDGALHAGDWQGRVHGWKVGSKAKVMDVVMPLSPRP
ncbi:MAG: hypothetical protein MUC36_01360 [Planctomycetes bacterium]|jgi:hypothetical protein|nr:hypothetical protein [Planctomycetota bacterium]